MGLFSNIVSGVKKSVVGKALDTLSAAFIAPISTTQAIFSKEKTIKEVIKKVEAKPLSEKVTATLLTTGAVATALYGGAAIAAGKGATVVSSLIPKTIAGKVTTAIATPVIIGTVVAKPTIIEELPKIPAQSYEIGKGIMGGEGIIETLKENPVGAAVLGGAAAIVGGKIIGSAASALTTKKILEGDTTKPITSTLELPKEATSKVLESDKGLPITAPTQTIQSGKKPRRRRAIIKPKQQNIRQSVNVVVSNKSYGITNKRYIKEYAYN